MDLRAELTGCCEKHMVVLVDFRCLGINDSSVEILGEEVFYRVGYGVVSACVCVRERAKQHHSLVLVRTGLMVTCMLHLKRTSSSSIILCP